MQKTKLKKHNKNIKKISRLFVVILFVMIIFMQHLYAAETNELELVKDISEGANGSYPGSIIDVNDTIFFRADDGIHGTELWKSDGTESGTVMVKDINVGSAGSNPGIAGDFFEFNGLTYFDADDGINGFELWRTDGTESGTQMVADMNPGSASFYPRLFIEMDEIMYFQAFDDEHGEELWKSDGTESGTTLIKDINVGSAGSNASIFFEFDGSIYFCANEGGHGYELWRSDGTEEGTQLFLDINSGIASSNPVGFFEFDGSMYFAAEDISNGKELWKSDGTESGTILVKDINPGSDQSDPGNLFEFNETLYFIATDGEHGYELWRSDGTEEGTKLFLDINPDGHGCIYKPFEFGGLLYFAADNDIDGVELWRSDGTEEGTRLFLDINPDGDSTPGDFIEFNGMLYFSADDGEHGTELWRTDGTEGGSQMIEDLYSDSSSGFEGELVKSGNNLYFSGADEIYGDSELWKVINVLDEDDPAPIPSTPEIEDITDITKNSLQLEIQVDQTYADHELDFEIKIKNRDDNDTDTKTVTKRASGNGKITINIEDLKHDTEYSFRIRFSEKDSGIFSEFSDSKHAETEKNIKNDEKCIINELKAKKNQNSILLTWDRSCKEINGVLIERKVGNGSFKQIASVDDNDTSYDDEYVGVYGIYTYRILGFKGDSYTDYSNEASVILVWKSEENRKDDQEEAVINDVSDDHDENNKTDKKNDDAINVYHEKVGKKKDGVRYSDVVGKIKEVADEFSAELAGVVFAGLAAGMAVAGSSAAIPLFATTPQPFTGGIFRLFSIMGIVSRKKKKYEDWGIVFDSQTRQSINGAIVSLIDENGHVADTTVSDSHGRYGFLPNHGNYAIMVSCRGYKLNTSSNEDMLYGTTYTGGNINIKEGQIEKINISLTATSINWQNFAKRKIAAYTSTFAIIKRDFFIVLFYTGFVIGLGIALMFPSPLNVVLLAIYLVLLGYQLFFKKNHYGLVKNSQTGKPVPFAMVALYREDDPHRRIAFAVSDVLGRYYLLAENGSYLAKFSGNTLGGQSFEKTIRVKVNDGMVREEIEI